MAEEFIAITAANNTPKPSWWRNFIQKVKMALYRMGVIRNYKITDRELSTLIERAYQSQLRGRMAQTLGWGKSTVEAFDGKEETADVYSLEKAVPSKTGYSVERVNENAGRDLNKAKGVVCETVNQVFDPADAPEQGFAKFITNKIVAFAAENGLLNKECKVPALNATLILTKRNFRSIGNHGGSDVKHNLVPVIPELLKNAVLIQTEVRKNKDNVISKSHLLAAKVRYGTDERYVAVMVIHESSGKFYYDHSLLVLKEGELGKKVKAENEKRNPATAGSSSQSAQILTVAQKALLSSGFDTKSEKNIRFEVGNVFTGSAADYDQPSLDYVGTGEGVQAFGWGLYGTDQEDIARGYARAAVEQSRENDNDRIIFDGKIVTIPYPPTSAPTELIPRSFALNEVVFWEGDIDGAINSLKEFSDDGLAKAAAAFLEDNRDKIVYLPQESIAELESQPKLVYFDGKPIDYIPPYQGGKEEYTRWSALDLVRNIEDVDKAIQVLKRGIKFYLAEEKLKFLEDNRDKIELRDNPLYNPTPHHLYRQTFFAGKEENLLLWNGKVTTEQKEMILDALSQCGNDPRIVEFVNDFRRELDYGTGEGVYSALSDFFGSQKAASEFLYSAGIDGVKYPANSGGRGDGSRGWNYVAFSDKDIHVDEHMRFALEDYSPEEKQAAVAILRKHVGTILDGDADYYYDLLQKEGVNYVEKADAKLFAALAVDANNKAIREHLRRRQWDWIYNNYDFIRHAYDYQGNWNFTIKPSNRFKGEEFTGTFISPEWRKYSGKTRGSSPANGSRLAVIGQKRLPSYLGSRA